MPAPIPAVGPEATPAERLTDAFNGFLVELQKWQRDPAWLARNNPVAYVAIRRAQRNGHMICRLDAEPSCE